MEGGRGWEIEGEWGMVMEGDREWTRWRGWNEGSWKEFES